jgi:DNA modification methylase
MNYHAKIGNEPLIPPQTPEERGLTNCWEGTARNGANWSLIHGDALKSLNHVSDGTIHCAVTSPPYFWLRDYGVSGQIGLEESVAEYVTAITSVMSKVKDKLRDDGVLFLNLGDTYYSGKGESQGEDKKSKKRRFGLRAVDRSGGLGIGLQRKSIIGIPWRVAIEMCGQGWVLRSPIVWYREKALPEAVQDRPKRSYEYIFMFVKSRKYFVNRTILSDPKLSEDVWKIAAKPKNGKAIDTAPFPDALVERCLDLGCPISGIVLDPFLGSGTTARVAVSRGLSVVGIELNKSSCEYAAIQMLEL